MEEDRPRYEMLLPAERRGIRFFKGHAPIITGIPEADNATTITILRDPVSRIQSFCQHVSEGKSPHLVGRFPPGSFDLKTFLRSGLDELEDLQTKMLINSGSCADPRYLHELGVERAVEVALSNLCDKIAVFGLQEAYDESLILFADRLGWQLPVYVSRNIRSQGKRLNFDSHDIDRINALTVADRALYAKAKTYFEKNLSLSPNQRNRLRRLQLVNRHIMPPYEGLRTFFRKIVRGR